MDRADQLIALGFLLFVLGVAGSIQMNSNEPLGAGLAFLVLVSFVVGLAFMLYGAVRSLRERGRKKSN